VFEQFRSASIKVEETEIFVRYAGRGPGILLLHGFPQTHVMWRQVAPGLTAEFSVVCADLRGYGASGKPPSAPDHAPYTKRAMARDMVQVMKVIGFDRFSVAGHDRGGRVAYRLALDHADCVERLALFDIIPTCEAFDRPKPFTRSAKSIEPPPRWTVRTTRSIGERRERLNARCLRCGARAVLSTSGTRTQADLWGSLLSGL
jgi:pimeloyl-ACP methyl ester carboxylesterase